MNCQKSKHTYVNINLGQGYYSMSNFLFCTLSFPLCYSSPKIITILIAKACFELNTKGIMQHVFFTPGFLGKHYVCERCYVVIHRYNWFIFIALQHFLILKKNNLFIHYTNGHEMRVLGLFWKIFQVHPCAYFCRERVTAFLMDTFLWWIFWLIK